MWDRVHLPKPRTLLWARGYFHTTVFFKAVITVVDFFFYILRSNCPVKMFNFSTNANLKSCFGRSIARYDRYRQAIFEQVLGFL